MSRPASDPSGLPLGLRLAFPLALVAITLAVFWPCVGYPFVALDDDANFELNFLYRGLGDEQLRWMWGWKSYHYGHWHPLTWTTFGWDYARAGLDAPSYHRTSLAIHALSVLTFWWMALELLRWCTGRVREQGERSGDLALHACAALATLAWAIHPLRVENVVWLTERRDLLSALFLFASVAAYLRMCRCGAARRAWLALALATYALSLLSKAWGMTLPVVLLALDVFPLRRWPSTSWRALLVEKLWFLPLAALTAYQAAAAQGEIAATVTLDEHGVLHRLAQASYGLCFYVLKTLWPTNLGCHYLLELDFDPRSALHLAAMASVVAITVLTFLLRRRAPALFATWFLYVVLVSPVLGLLQSGAQKVADRYAQLGAIPLVFLAAGALLAWLDRRPASAARALLASLAPFALVLGFFTRAQVRVWSSSETLFQRAVAADPDNYFVLHNLAVMLYRRTAWAEAIEIEQRSVDAHPGRGNELARHTLGLLYQMQGRMDEAERVWRSAVEWQPEPDDARWRGRLEFWMPDPSLCLTALRGPLGSRGAWAELAELHERGIARRPDVLQLYTDLDALYAQLARAQERVALWERAEQVAVLARGRVAAGLGRALIAAGRAREAESQVFRAVALERTLAQDALDGLSAATQRSGLPATLELFERARRAAVPGAMVENGIGKAYLAANRLAEAEPYLLRAQALDSQSRGYVVDVCELFLKQGRRDDALRNLRALLDVDPQNARAKALLAQAAGGGR
ncbi:MAG: hypothetical protein FJ298_08855 [Planctomycetes bacterium]|nr:hypothetical protein [Planctomycetota bacterium]